MTTRSEITKQKVGIRGEKPERQRAEVGGQKSDPVRFLTRHELAEALKVSVRTVDTMLAGGEIPHLRLHGNFIRFYLPDVVRHLTATALVSKRCWAGPLRKAECGVQSAESRQDGQEVSHKGNKGNEVRALKTERRNGHL